MNLTNFRQTPIARVVEAVRREAQRYGVAVHHSELVGLTPQDALVDAAVWYTQLDDFKSDQLLENRLFEVIKTSAQPSKDQDFLDRLASADPTPGGGSAAAHTAAAAAALVAMVGRVTLGKKKYAEVEPQMLEMVKTAEELRTQLTSAVDEDARSFDGFLQATRLPKDTDEQRAVRAKAMENATKEAARVPYQVVKTCLKVLNQAVIAATLGNLNAISDAASAAHLAVAAMKCAAANVRINVKSLEDPSELASLVEDSKLFITKAQELEDRVLEALAARAGI